MHHRIVSTALTLAVALTLSGGAFAQTHDHSGMAMPAATAGAKSGTVAFTTPAAFRGQLDGVYTAYLALQAAFSGDAFPSVKTNAGKFAEALQKVDMKLLTDNRTHMAWMTASANLAKSAGKIANAGDMETARTAFKPFSETLIATAKQFGTSGKRPLYVLHCPMALNNTGADWVQADKTAKNPYFGKTMLACGKVTETISGGSGK